MLPSFKSCIDLTDNNPLESDGINTPGKRKIPDMFSEKRSHFLPNENVFS
jgi:hypothetical protein